VLTDDEPKLLAGGPGLSFGRSEDASESLLADLRSDSGMKWVPDDMWLSYLQVDAAAEDLDYDLAISTHEATQPSLERAGISAPDARTLTPPGPGVAWWPLGIGLLTGSVAVIALRARRNRHRVEGAATR
jgi:hypothetical protein